MARREYVGGATETTLSGSLNAAATTINGTDFTDWPTGGTGPFTVDVDYDNSSYEKILCLSRTGNVITIDSASDRGYDDTTDTSHNSGATIRHVAASVDFDEANAHINNVGTVKHTSAALGTDSVTATQIAAGAVGDDELAATGLDISKFTTGTSDRDTTGSAATLTTARDFDIAGDTTTAAVSFDGSGNVTLEPTVNTATALRTARDFTIAGDVTATAESFDGSGNVELTTALGTGVVETSNLNLTFGTWSPTISGWAIGNGTVVARYIEIGDFVIGMVNITPGSTTTFATRLNLTAPVTAHSDWYSQPVGIAQAAESGGATYFGQARLSTDGLRLEPFIGNASSAHVIRDNASFATTNPFAWGTGDTVQITFTYEKA